MTVLNLLSPAKSDIQFSVFAFPDGQPHIKIDPDRLPADRRECLLLTRLANPSDLLLALLVKNSLDNLGFERVDLAVSYLLAARMDRVMTPGEPFSLKVVTTLLNGAGFRRIRVFDPHSDVATALLDRSEAIDNAAFIGDAIADYQKRNSAGAEQSWCLVSPDAGALKKVHKVAQVIGANRVVECLKVRDVKTGHLSGFKVFDDDLNGQTCFIVDDICDGGGTFIGIANLLKAHNAGAVVLMVSHGIFSKGFDLPGIDVIYATNSFRDFSVVPDSVRILPVEPYLIYRNRQ